MGYEDLNVVDPTSGEAKAANTDLSDVSLLIQLKECINHSSFFK